MTNAPDFTLTPSPADPQHVSISDDRLVQLMMRMQRKSMACELTGSPIVGKEYDDVASLLRELQLRRAGEQFPQLFAATEG